MNTAFLNLASAAFGLPLLLQHGGRVAAIIAGVIFGKSQLWFALRRPMEAAIGRVATYPQPHICADAITDAAVVCRLSLNSRPSVSA